VATWRHLAHGPPLATQESRCTQILPGLDD
jgi:hypothetical protein